METVFLYAPNIFNDTAGGTYHATAYINSIVNVLHKTPYEYWTTSIYGHYGLFYYVPVKVLQFCGVNQWIAITTCIAIFGGVCFISETLLIHKLIKNDSLYIFAILANALIKTQIYRGQYWQVNPHRLLFPALVLLLSYAYYEIEKGQKEKIYYISLWIISLCSIIWNFECGVVCIFVCFLVCTYKQCVQDQIKIKLIIQNIVIAVMAVIGALFIVNIYNKFCGGGWVSFKEFIYPLGSVEYNIEGLWLPLGTPFMPHYFVIVLFLGVICFNLKKIFSLKADSVELMLTLSAILGLGVLTYYMNRVVNSNMSISAFEIVLVLGVLLDKNAYIIQKFGTNIVEFDMRQGLYLVGTFILTSMCLSTIGSISPAISIYYAGDYNTENLGTMIETFDNAIPEGGSVAFVGGQSAILSSMLNSFLYNLKCR